MKRYRKEIRELQRQYWVQRLSENGQSVLRTSLAVQINRTALYKTIALLGVPFTPRKAKGNWGDLV
jgi:DNA-binding NtrC family response regulator